MIFKQSCGFYTTTKVLFYGIVFGLQTKWFSCNNFSSRRPISKFKQKRSLPQNKDWYGIGTLQTYMYPFTNKRPQGAKINALVFVRGYWIVYCSSNFEFFFLLNSQKTDFQKNTQHCYVAITVFDIKIKSTINSPKYNKTKQKCPFLHLGASCWKQTRAAIPKSISTRIFFFYSEGFVN